jgi:hypothetical protein
MDRNRILAPNDVLRLLRLGFNPAQPVHLPVKPNGSTLRLHDNQMDLSRDLSRRRQPGRSMEQTGHGNGRSLRDFAVAGPKCPPVGESWRADATHVHGNNLLDQQLFV